MNEGRGWDGAVPSPPWFSAERVEDGGTIDQGHHLEKIVAGNEPAVSGGFGSPVTTHNDHDAM